MVLKVMTIFLTLLGLGAHAGVQPFPARATVELRLTLQAHLTGRLPPAALTSIQTSKVDAVTLAVTALEEVDRVLDAGPEPLSLSRITKTLDWVADLRLPARPNEFERDRLRRALRPFLARARASKLYHRAVTLYRNLDLWDEADSIFVVEEVAQVRHLIDRYDLIVRIAKTMDEVARDDLGLVIQAHKGHPLMRFVLLDEIGILPAQYHAPALLMIRNLLRPTPGRRAPDRERAERRVCMRLLERWQDRLVAGDPAVTEAFEHLESTTETAVEHAFLDQFRRRSLALHPSESTLVGPDPLGLIPTIREPQGNVIPFASCGHRLTRRGRGR